MLYMSTTSLIWDSMLSLFSLLLISLLSLLIWLGFH